MHREGNEMSDIPRPEPCAVALAPNGGRRTKADHPALPETPAEIAEDAARAFDAGAAMLHLHVRDARGRHVLDADAYNAATAAVRGAVGDGLVVQITSESLGRYTPAEQFAVIRAVRPEAVSLALREVVPGPDDEPAFADALLWMRDAGVMPQIIVYDPSELARLADLRMRGVIPWDDVPVLVALGRYADGQIAQPRDILPFVAEGAGLPREWMLCAFGPHEPRVVVGGALMGASVRVGFENNLHSPDGTPARDNASQVAAVVAALDAAGVPRRDGPGLRAHWRALLDGAA